MSKSIKIAFIVMIGGLLVASLWNRFPLIKEIVNTILDPTAGRILDYNINMGMIAIVAVITLLLTLVQRFTTNQNELKKLKEEQKILKEQMQEFKNEPEKLLELNKKQLEFIPRTWELTLPPLLYTFVPIILFFRWFSDYFANNPTKIFGFFSWFWAYLLLSIIFSMIYRKLFKMP